MNELSKEAQKLIADYLALPLGAGARVPYFNNRRAKIRGGLRALVGKGSPQDIAEEARIIALRDKVAIETLDITALKKYLVDRGLGVDCSGFAYHVLDAECRVRRGKPISKFLYIPSGFLRRILARLRTAERTDVTVFSHPKNSAPVPLSRAEAGDIITMLNPKYNHILVVRKTSRENGKLRLDYAHSFSWPDDGVYGTGVREGAIMLPDKSENLLEGEWAESGRTGAENFTFLQAAKSDRTELRRLNAFSS